MRKVIIAAAVSAATLQAAVPATSLAEEGCCFRITPYLWTIGIDGDIQAHGEDSNVSMDFDDILDNLDMAGSVLLEADMGRWVSYAMVDYLALDTGDVETRFRGVDADLEMESTLATVATGYRFQTGERSTVDLQVGIRYAQFDNQLEIEGLGQRDADNNIYDGIVALRPRLALSQYWYFSPTLSVGAGDSDLTWEVSPQFVYACCGFDIRFGYRSLNYEFEKGSDSLDLTTSGPMLGVGFAF
jgi:hypothetical protein